ncbi:unnamed protein product [Parnassius apollo]|uniref:(apollo) hypothetical protein n=1 Tax=Parnassius apollo TaxID=110799 RepID=A0A8S3Y0F8_PARAO|nr:unnamed protein product [Parnassius apollo]
MELNDKVAVVTLSFDWIDGGVPSFVTGWGRLGVTITGPILGDSGSPLISRETGHQIGIASWAHPCARGVPDVFARINSFKNFLLPILRSF